MKNLRRLACKFDLDQSERKSSQVNASARKPWPNGVASRGKLKTWVYLRLRLARALPCVRLLELIPKRPALVTETFSHFPGGHLREVDCKGYRMVFASICEHASSAFIFCEHEQ